MTILLKPLLDALNAARGAAAGLIHPDDEVTVDDQPDRYVFEFIPQADVLGGGVRIAVAKSDFKIMAVIRAQ